MTGRCRSTARRLSPGRVAQILRVIIEGGAVRIGYVDDRNRYHSGVLVSERAFRRLSRLPKAGRGR